MWFHSVLADRGSKALIHNIVRTLSKRGICSRKQAVQLVQEGRVEINGRTIRDPGFHVKDQDRIRINGKAPSHQKKNRILVFYKPAGVITTRQDEKNRLTVYEFLHKVKDWVFPVGRLDQDSEGLLIFTNDTELGERLTNPRYQIPRTYEVWVEGTVSPEELEEIQKGVEIGRGERSGRAEVKILKAALSSTRLEIALTEGKNREIRRIFESLKKPVKRLLRTKFGPFRLGSLKPGEWREVQSPGASS